MAAQQGRCSTPAGLASDPTSPCAPPCRSFTVVLRHELFAGAAALPALSREESALVDYYLGLNAHQFVGNSVSSFSAMIIMER